MPDNHSALRKTDISSYVEACFRSFEELQSTCEYAPHDLRTKLARFRSWVGNIGAHHRDQLSLDTRMRKIPQVRNQMLNSLEDLQEILDDACSILRGERIPWDQLSDSCSESESGSAFGDSEKKFTEFDQLMLGIDDTIICLFRLSMAIRDLGLYDMYVNIAHAAIVEVSISSDADIIHVRDKFPSAPKYLAINLGKAITRRREFFIHRRTQNDRLFKGINHGTISDVGIRAISGNEPKRKTGSEPQISVPNPALEEILVVSMDPEMDLRSQEGGLTRTSFATSKGGFQERQFRMPPIPQEGLSGNPFSCPFCFVIIAVNGRRSWKKHVFKDLHPYVCTFTSCSSSHQLFQRRHEWFGHERTFHRDIWSCPECTEHKSDYRTDVELFTHISQDHPSSVFALPSAIESLPCKMDNDCPLCSQKDIPFRDLEKHLGGHQEQLAFFSLPPIYDGNFINSNSATENVSGTRGSARDSISIANSGNVPITVENMTDNLSLMSLTQESVDMIAQWSQQTVISQRSEEGGDETGGDN